MLTSVPEGFQEHIIWAFSKRAKQQDMVLCRLALFLDPRFRQAALNSSSSATTMSQFISTAAKYGHSQGWDAAKINTLLMQLSHYSDCIPPFDLAYTGPGFNCRSWWSTVGKDAAGAVLAELAGVLLDVVPHAAGPERVFSQMGWFQGGNSSLLAPSTNAKKVAIKMHYDALKPSKRK